MSLCVVRKEYFSSLSSATLVSVTGKIAKGVRHTVASALYWTFPPRTINRHCTNKACRTLRMQSSNFNYFGTNGHNVINAYSKHSPAFKTILKRVATAAGRDGTHCTHTIFKHRRVCRNVPCTIVVHIKTYKLRTIHAKVLNRFT